MTYLIGLLSVVFLVLAIMIVNKSMALSKGIQKDSESEVPVDGANNLNAVGMVLFLVLGSIGAAWSFLHSQPDFLPVAASEHGLITDRMFWISMGIITFAFFVTNALLFIFAFRYRWKKNNVAVFYPVNHKLELIWTVIPAIVMAVLVFTGWRTWRDITSKAPENAVVIEVTGHQFGWYVRYSGNDDSKLGNYNYKLIDDTNNIGIDYTDQNSFDDFTANEMHIPKGVPVLLKIHAQDVLHSVYLPYQRVKMDAVPGMPTKFWFVANKSTEEMRYELGKADFNYKLNCTEICGRGHFGMAITVFVDEPEDYAAWCKQQKPFLTQNPTYLAKVPENLKAKAGKYIEAAAPADSSTAETEAAPVAGTSSALR
ncbi:cytochrome c oxidase subunit 2 [Pseudarcicella hirudinis]|uniref:Cytochrome c oxidase subunit 2 n=1 Tax=Pseudarcicella hirudinis TaxID=1079859 RepID=A0A1I5WL90_9BACT|nr:cytochrome c oxidase subunit II [Pseudarcicella hirudinis]SFQ20573.1 cytochrome c oxidase subunit 2 [Pseudarcicella hirudinis]